MKFVVPRGGGNSAGCKDGENYEKYDVWDQLVKREKYM